MGRKSALFLCTLVPFLAFVGFLVLFARVIERTDAELGEAGLEFLLSSVDRTIELNLQLGLPITELQRADAILEAAVASAPDVLAADLFGVEGETLFSTDRGAVGERVPAAWLAAIEDTIEGGWRARERETVTLGRPIANDFGRPEGWIALIVDANRLSPPLSRTPALFVAVAPVVGGTLVLAFACGVAWYVFAVRPGQRAATALVARRPFTAPRSPLDDAVNSAIAGAQMGEAVVDRVHQDLRRLDATI